MPASKIDVIVVGAGASGAVIASELAQAGQKVVLLDKGPKHTTEDFRLKQDEIRYYARGSLGTANPLHLPPSLGAGGGTIHWGGACWRFRETEFRMKSEIEERLGKDALPEGHTLVDWPISYADMEPYYDKTE